MFCHLNQRITIAEMLENDWFKKGYKLPVFEHQDVSLDDIDAIFNAATVSMDTSLLRTFCTSFNIT